MARWQIYGSNFRKPKFQYDELKIRDRAEGGAGGGGGGGL